MSDCAFIILLSFKKLVFLCTKYKKKRLKPNIGTHSIVFSPEEAMSKSVSVGELELKVRHFQKSAYLRLDEKNSTTV